METWYLLFGGTSVDGAGPGKYVGRTTDKAVAMNHYLACAKDPYSTGYVEIITDTTMERAWTSTHWNKTA